MSKPKVHPADWQLNRNTLLAPRSAAEETEEQEAYKEAFKDLLQADQDPCSELPS